MQACSNRPPLAMTDGRKIADSSSIRMQLRNRGRAIRGVEALLRVGTPAYESILGTYVLIQARH